VSPVLLSSDNERLLPLPSMYVVIVVSSQLAAVSIRDVPGNEPINRHVCTTEHVVTVASSILSIFAILLATRRTACEALFAIGRATKPISRASLPNMRLRTSSATRPNKPTGDPMRWRGGASLSTPNALSWSLSNGSCAAVVRPARRHFPLC